MNIYVILAIIISLALLFTILFGVAYIVIYLQSSRIVKAYYEAFSDGLFLYIAYKDNVKSLVAEYEEIIRDPGFFINIVQRIKMYEFEEEELREDFNTSFRKFIKCYNSSLNFVKCHYNGILNTMYDINSVLTRNWVKKYLHSFIII